MIANSFISETSVSTLRSAIGSVVDYGVFPGLDIRRIGATGLNAVCELERAESLEFFIARPISLRLSDMRGGYSWLSLDSGPDEPETTEGIVATNPTEPCLGPCAWASFSDGWKIAECDSDPRPAILHLWPESRITSIEILRIGAYGAVVFQHDGVRSWAFYGEYDGDAFVTLDGRVCDALRVESDESLILMP